MANAQQHKADRKVRTLAEYIAAVAAARQRLTQDSNFAPVWYRGHRVSAWELRPTLLRDSLDRESERELLRDFKLRAGYFLPRLPKHDLDWIYVMRHHGIPTRILDWSENPLIALYFALHESKGDVPAAVWAFDPWALNQLSSSIGQKSIPTVVIGGKMEKYVLHERPGQVVRRVKAKAPAAFRPEHAIGRAVGQAGMGTVHGQNDTPLESIAAVRSRMLKIEIEAGSCAAMFRELFDAGTTASTIFPDLDGLAADLSYRYLHRSTENPELSPSVKSRSRLAGRQPSSGAAGRSRKRK